MLPIHKSAKRIKHYISKVEIKKQLYIVYFIAGILPILVIGIYLLINTKNLVLRQHFSQASADNVRVRSIVLDVTISILNISDDLFSDRELQSLLASSYGTREDSYAACRNYTKLNTYASRYTEISKILVYYHNESMYDYGHFKKATEEIRAADWYKKADKSWGNHWVAVSTPDAIGNEAHELALVRKIPILGTKDYAVLFVSISQNYLKSRINTSPLINEVTVNKDPIFYATQYSRIGKLMNVPIDYNQRFFSYEGITSYNGQEALVELSTLLMVRSQDKVYIATVDTEAIPNTNRITRVSALIVIISLLVPLIMVSLFSKTFSARIKTLRQEMHKVSSGDLNIIEDFNGNDELVDLYTDLKTMIECIKKMDEEIYSERIARQEMINHQHEMQFEMLASKINPHFLFNTLETIRMKANTSGNKEVANAIKLLGKSMRHVLETGGKLVTLKSEIDYITVYLDIQKLRFTDKIDYEIRVSNDIMPEEYKVLPLLLQPIVENAFIHGLENKEKDGRIGISMAREDDKLVIAITDNGTGMMEDELSALLKRIKEPNHTQKSIGLYNIYQRIRLYYGEQYGMEIHSVKGQGTTVYVRLPLNARVEDKSKLIG